MSDQMPDEVWLDGFENKGFWFAWPHPDDSEPHMRYIRADLHEQAEAERDRLRAYIKRALPQLHEAMRHVRVDQWPAVHNALDAMRDLEEALDHE